ncbi:MAG TPA: hypothetical protein VF207_02510 [Chthoniobacterales bacterium]
MRRTTQKNRVSTSMIIIGVAMVLLFLGLVALLVLQREHVQTYDEVRKEHRLKNLAELNGENERILTQYHWVDKAKGVVGIPINQAMSLVLAELQSVRPHAAGPISNPSPGTGAAPGPSVTPAPAATPVSPQSSATNP